MSKVIQEKQNKFLVKFMINIALFIMLLALSVVLNETNNLSIFSTGVLAISPVVPIIFSLRLVVCYYRSLDEYIQRVMGESLLWSVGIVGILSMAYGLLAQMVEVPNCSPGFMLPAIAIVFAIAQFIQLGGHNNGE